ncbi:hypothetical protein PP1_014470 [Pseudonocardia sp. P1]
MMVLSSWRSAGGSWQPLGLLDFSAVLLLQKYVWPGVVLGNHVAPGHAQVIDGALRPGRWRALPI